MKAASDLGGEMVTPHTTTASPTTHPPAALFLSAILHIVVGVKGQGSQPQPTRCPVILFAVQSLEGLHSCKNGSMDFPVPNLLCLLWRESEEKVS